MGIAQEYEEDFDLFLKRFDQNSSFQFSRLQDSITVEYSSDIIIDEDGNGYTESITNVISRNDWRLKRLDSREDHDWTIERIGDMKMSLTIVSKMGGVFVVIDFVLVNGLWFLEKYADYTV